jgi:hypothetical protein
MRKTKETDEYVVYDDVLSKEDFQRVSTSTQAENYSIPHINGWLKVWRMSDGLPMGGQNYSYNSRPFNNHMDMMGHIFSEVARMHSNLLPSYNDLSMRSYLYGRDTKLSWHNDAGYSAAAIFYTHKYWASTWGGELLIAKTPKVEGGVPNPCLEHEFEDKFLEYYGYGEYITCKPNRLVFTKGGVWHSINRVDKDAGDHVRCSIVAFYKDNNQCSNQHSY